MDSLSLWCLAGRQSRRPGTRGDKGWALMGGLGPAGVPPLPGYSSLPCSIRPRANSFPLLELLGASPPLVRLLPSQRAGTQ